MKKINFIPGLLVLAIMFSCKKEIQPTDKDVVNADSPHVRVLGTGATSSPTRTLVSYESAIGSTADLKMEVKIWSDCGDNAHFNHEEVVVDPDYVLIGGGARVSDFNNSSTGSVNAMLCASYPADDGNFDRYIAESKDHYYSYAHRLWVYAIGMKLSYFDAGVSDWVAIPVSTLKAQMNITTTVSTVPNGGIMSPAPSGYTPLCGGGRCLNNQYATWGRLLTYTGVVSGNVSLAIGKDHYYSDPGYIEGSVLSIQNVNPMNTSEPLFLMSKSDGETFIYYNNQSVPSYVNSGYMLSSVAGLSLYNSQWGRMLVGAYPINGYSATAISKDHIVADYSGRLVCETLGIRPY